MARKENPISVRFDLNRNSNSIWFNEGDRESHQIGPLLVLPDYSIKEGRYSYQRRT